MISTKHILTVILSMILLSSFSQKFLDLTYISLFGKEKTFQFFVNREFSYRLKGELFYHTHILTNMNDSLLMFDNEEIVKLDRIRSIRIQSAKFAGWLYAAGIGFIALDAVGNLIQSKSPIITERALMAGGSIIAVGAIVSYFQDKHIRITKNCIFRVIDIDTQHLNVSKMIQESQDK